MSVLNLDTGKGYKRLRIAIKRLMFYWFTGGLTLGGISCTYAPFGFNK